MHQLSNPKQRNRIRLFLFIVFYTDTVYALFHAIKAFTSFEAKTSSKLVLAYSAIMTIVFCLCAFRSWGVKKIVNKPTLEFSRLKKQMDLTFVANLAVSVVSIVEAVLIWRYIRYDPSLAEYRNVPLIGLFMLKFMALLLVVYSLPFLILLIWQMILSRKALAPLGEAESSVGDCSISTEAMSASKPIDHGFAQQVRGVDQQSKNQPSYPYEGYQVAPAPSGTAF